MDYNEWLWCQSETRWFSNRPRGSPAVYLEAFNSLRAWHKWYQPWSVCIKVIKIQAFFALLTVMCVYVSGVCLCITRCSDAVMALSVESCRSTSVLLSCRSRTEATILFMHDLNRRVVRAVGYFRIDQTAYLSHVQFLSPINRREGGASWLWNGGINYKLGFNWVLMVLSQVSSIICLGFLGSTWRSPIYWREGGASSPCIGNTNQKFSIRRVSKTYAPCEFHNLPRFTWFNLKVTNPIKGGRRITLYWRQKPNLLL